MITPDFTPRPHADQLEIWRDVPNYEGYYQVSNLGHVKRVKAGIGTYIGKTLKYNLAGAGYPCVYLSRNSTVKPHYIHRLVALVFLPCPTEEQYQVNHKNKNKLDNRVENLEWCTPHENIVHSYANGQQAASGERAGNAKLTWDQVREMRRLRSEGTSYKQLAMIFNMSRENVRTITLGRTWKEN